MDRTCLHSSLIDRVNFWPWETHLGYHHQSQLLLSLTHCNAACLPPQDTVSKRHISAMDYWWCSKWAGLVRAHRFMRLFPSHPLIILFSFCRRRPPALCATCAYGSPAEHRYGERGPSAGGDGGSSTERLSGLGDADWCHRAPPETGECSPL